MLSFVQLGITGLLSYNLLQNLKNRKILRERTDFSDGILKGLTLAIPVRNEFDNLRILIPQIVDSRLRPEKVIFLDDQSTDHTSDLV